MKLGTAIIMVLALTQIAFGAYTYTYGPGTYFDELILHGTESILVNGGGGYRLGISDWSRGVIEGTSLSGITSVSAGTYGHLDISGGKIGGVDLGGYARLTINGGRVDYLTSALFGSVPALPEEYKIQFICQSWDYNSTKKLLTGVWEDDSLFSIQLVNTTGYTSTYENIYFTIVPEPLSIALLGLGGLAVRRWTRA